MREKNSGSLLSKVQSFHQQGMRRDIVVFVVAFLFVGTLHLHDILGHARTGTASRQRRHMDTL